MSGTHHLYTPSGRAMPPPPRTTPKRSSSVCRTPTRRFNPAAWKSGSSRDIGRSATRQSTTREGRLVPARDNRLESPDSAGWSRSRFMLEDKHAAPSRALTHHPSEHPFERRHPQPHPRGHAVGSVDPSAPRWSGGVSPNGRHRPEDGRDPRANPQHDPGSAAAVGPRPARSLSPRGDTPEQPLSVRLRRSLSRGMSPQREHPTRPSVVGTELMAPMPRLQGTQQTSKNRDRRTIERFIESQPPPSQPELRAMLDEYSGREEALCEALTDAYGDAWEAAVRGAGDTNGSAEMRPQSLRSTPSRPTRATPSSATPERDEEVSPRPRQLQTRELRGVSWHERSAEMLTPPVPQDLTAH